MIFLWYITTKTLDILYYKHIGPTYILYYTYFNLNVLKQQLYNQLHTVWF